MVMLLRPFAFLALLAAPALVAAGPTPRAPTAKWTVNFADAQCLAMRNYGTAEDPVRLILKSPAIGDVVQVAISRKGHAADPSQSSAMVALDGGAPFSTSMLAYTPAGGQLRIYSINMPAAQFALIRHASDLRVRGDGLDERFSLSQMEPLLKIVDDCVADLRRVFNVTGGAPDDPSLVRTRSKASLASYFTDKDYPAIALDLHQGGVVKFAMLIDENGRVADCTIIETSGVAALDTQACALLRLRARFHPAARGGQPTKDAVTGTITWQTE